MASCPPRPGIERIVSSAKADAIILTDVVMDDARIPALRAAGVPAALIGIPADPADLDCVDLDFAEAGKLCIAHLAELGHREVAFIGEPDGVYSRRAGFAERTLAGIRAGAAAADVGLVHRPCDNSYEAAAGVLVRVLEERPRTTGFIIQNEAVIPPLMSLLRTAGRVVPEDVSIVALSPGQIAAQALPRLTSVTVPAIEFGSRAVAALMRRLANGRGGGVELIPPVLTIGSSTMAARTYSETRSLAL